MTSKVKVKDLPDLQEAERGSYYTVVGAGGDLNEWVDGYEKILAEEGIGKPKAWFRTTGLAVNEYVNPNWRDAFQNDLAFLLFPLNGLDIGKLAMFKIRMEDRWFDDIVANMRRM